MSDNRSNKFLALLESTRQSHAVTSLISPKRRTAFEYGRVSGFFQGMQVAQDLYVQLISEEEKTRDERSKNR